MTPSELQAAVAQCSTLLELCQHLEMGDEVSVLFERLAVAKDLVKQTSMQQQQQSVWDTSGHTSMRKNSSPTFSPVATAELLGGGEAREGGGEAAESAVGEEEEQLSEEEQKKVDEELLTAARKGDEEGVRDLLARGAQPNGAKDVR